MINKIKDYFKKQKTLDTLYGHKKSVIKKQSVDINFREIPWYTYPSIEFIDQFDLTNKNIFEWGCGNSSVFFSNRCSKIKSIEHDEDWYNKIRFKKNLNHEIILKSIEDYPSEILADNEKYDIIIIDGERRLECAKNITTHLQSNGMIILDNSDWFYITANFLKEKYNLIQVDFHGFGPINNYTWTTSIFITKDFDFQLKNNRQPNNPIGGILHDESDIIKKEDIIYNTNNSVLIKNNGN